MNEMAFCVVVSKAQTFKLISKPRDVGLKKEFTWVKKNKQSRCQETQLTTIAEIWAHYENTI